MHYACKEGHWEIVGLILSYSHKTKINLELKNNLGFTPQDLANDYHGVQFCNINIIEVMKLDMLEDHFENEPEVLGF